MYNQDFKNRFLENYSASTQIYYKYILQKSYETESMLNKDIYEMDNNELDSLLKSYCNGSVQAVASVLSVLKIYLDFANKEGYIETKVNYLQGIGGYEDLLKYVDVNIQGKKYVTRAELEEIAGSCVNAQDALCLILPFEGVKGEDAEEIINLKESDVGFISNELTLTKNNGETRKIIVSDLAIDYIRRALDEEFYYKNNGEDSPDLKSNHYVITKTDYVLRVAARQCEGAIKATNITARLNRIKQYWGNQYWTVTGMWYSGMLDMAKQIKEEKGELDKEDWIVINERFGYSAGYWTKTKARLQEML